MFLVRPSSSFSSIGIMVICSDNFCFSESRTAGRSLRLSCSYDIGEDSSGTATFVFDIDGFSLLGEAASCMVFKAPDFCVDVLDKDAGLTESRLGGILYDIYDLSGDPPFLPFFPFFAAAFFFASAASLFTFTLRLTRQ